MLCRFQNQEEDYVNTLKQCLAEEYEGEVKVTKFSPTHSPVFEVIYIKEKCISQVNNIELVNAKLTKEYTIYKIVENNVTKNYALTLDQAQLIVVKLRNEANKATAITIEPIIVTDLSLITDEAAIGGDIDLLCNDNLANYDVTKTEIEEALKAEEGAKVELTGTEDKIAYARQFYNDTVQMYNEKLMVFPNNIIVSLFGANKFTPKTFFEVTDDMQREPVKVSF